jgi:hypothetical protein
MRREMVLRGKKEGEREEGWLGRCREASGGGRPTTAENASISPTRGDKRRSTPFGRNHRSRISSPGPLAALIRCGEKCGGSEGCERFRSDRQRSTAHDVLSSCIGLNMIWTSFISFSGPRPPLRPSPCLLSCPRQPELLQALQARCRCSQASQQEER